MKKLCVGVLFVVFSLVTHVASGQDENQSNSETERLTNKAGALMEKVVLGEDKSLDREEFLIEVEKVLETQDRDENRKLIEQLRMVIIEAAKDRTLVKHEALNRYVPQFEERSSSLFSMVNVLFLVVNVLIPLYLFCVLRYYHNKYNECVENCQPAATMTSDH